MRSSMSPATPAAGVTFPPDTPGSMVSVVGSAGGALAGGEAGFGRAPLAKPVVAAVDGDAGPAAGFVVLERGKRTLGTT
jgi:hypothetical protein